MLQEALVNLIKLFDLKNYFTTLFQFDNELFHLQWNYVLKA